MVSVRLHDSLTKELKKIAGAKGRDFTDLVTEVLDQYCQFENGKRKN